jgi:ABC-type Fe3+-hydroxamate transport system substrate-binding protein
MRIVSFVPAATEWLVAFGASHLIAEMGDGPPSLAEDADLLIVGRDEDARSFDRQRPIEIVHFHPKTFKDALDAALNLARLSGVLSAAMRFIGDHELRLQNLRTRLSRLEGASDESAVLPTVVLLNSVMPPLSIGRWEADLIEMAGGKSAGTRAAGSAPLQGISALQAANPDVLVLALGDADQMGQITAHIAQDEDWASLRAIRDGHVWLIDGDRYATTPGPSLYRSVELVAAAIHGPGLGVSESPDELRILDVEVSA